MSLKLGLAGDVMLGRLVNDHLKRVEPDYVWGDLLPLLRETDCNLINLETALTSCTTPVEKVFNFRTDPQHVEVLQTASIDLVNLANNHTLDFTVQGLLETLETLDRAGIGRVGAGKNLTEAQAPWITTVKDCRIGVIGCTDNEPDWEAGAAEPGIFYVEVGDLPKLLPVIEKVRPQVDLLILSIHWGPNMRESPSPEFRRFAHQLIDHGVDVIHGHSAHIFQGIEAYRSGLILYDTGDFIDDYAIDPYLRNDHSFFFELLVGDQGWEQLTLHPTRIDRFQVNLAHGDEQLDICERMMGLSRAFATSLERTAEGTLLLAR